MWLAETAKGRFLCCFHFRFSLAVKFCKRSKWGKERGDILRRNTSEHTHTQCLTKKVGNETRLSILTYGDRL